MTAESCLFAPFCRPSSQHTGPDKEWTCKSLLNMFRTTNTSFNGKIYMWVWFFLPHHTAPWPWIDPGPSPVKAPVLTTGPSQELPSMYVNIILAIRRVIKHDAKHAGRSQIVKDQVKYTKKPSVEFWKENEMIPAVLSSHLVTIWSTGQEGEGKRWQGPTSGSSSEDREKGWIQGLLRS